MVLSFEPASLAAYLLHAAIALWLGAARHARDRARAWPAPPLLRLLLLRGAVTARPRFATTRPSRGRFAITAPMAIAVSFHWIHRLSSGLGMANLMLPLCPVRVGVPRTDAGIARLRPAAGEGPRDRRPGTTRAAIRRPRRRRRS